MVYYFAFYGLQKRRNHNYAAEDKIDYICSALNELGSSVTIVSSAISSDGKIQKKIHRTSDKGNDIIYFTSFPRKNLLFKAIDSMIRWLSLIMFVLFQINSDDTVIVYHSLYYRNLFKWLHRIKKFFYVLEVEELYQYIADNKAPFKKREQDIFLFADAYICSTKKIAELININDKGCLIINGIYKNESVINTKVIEKGIVYAGTLEKQKGIDSVIRAAKYLSSDYQIHIAGFGGKNDLDRVLKLIEKNNSCKNAKVYYDGVFKGNEYKKYLQQFAWGICIQDSNDIFNEYEFPSKIFSYMANGLGVVSNDLPQLQSSKIYPHLIVSPSENIKDIAKTIELAFSIKRPNTQQLIEELDEDFKANLLDILRRKSNDNE